MDEKSYSKRVRMADGTFANRYTAIDPAKYAIVCTCGKPDCVRVRFLPFRDHIAKLHYLISRLMDEDALDSYSFGWLGVVNGLRLAASIEDIEADTGYVDDPLVFALCETTIDYENASSEMASKYVAGATIFSFCWQAYEAAVRVTATTELRGLLKEERFGERGRRLFESRLTMSPCFSGLTELLRLAIYQCEEGGLFTDRLNKVRARVSNEGFILAAEIAREFRNFLFHGEDEPPAHEEWGAAVVTHCRLCRFYTVSRLILYLIQALAWIEVGDAGNLIELQLKGRVLLPRDALETAQFS
jgi:hypothetical protein